MVSNLVVTFAFFFELAGGAFLTIISMLTFSRYLERRRIATLYLSSAILSMGIAIIISSVGRLFALMAGITPQYHGYQYTPIVWIPLALVGNVVGDIFFLLFTNDVFYNSNKKFGAIIIIIGLVLAGLLFQAVPTPSTNLLTGEPSQAYINTFQLMWLLMAAFTFFTGGLVTISAFRESRKERPLVEVRGLQLIALLGICLATANIMFIIDEQLTVYFGGDFSIFYYLGWISAHLGVIFAYLGFVLPNWLRKRWE